MLADEETIKWPQVSGCRHNLAASASGFCAECSVDYFEEKSIANQRSFHQQSLETNSRKNWRKPHMLSRYRKARVRNHIMAAMDWNDKQSVMANLSFQFHHRRKLDWVNCKGGQAPRLGVIKAAVI